MNKGNGNGKGGRDLIVNLHGEIAELREAMARHHQESEGRHQEMAGQFQEMARNLQQMARNQHQMATAMVRHHRETDQHLVRITRMLGHLGDRLNDHEQRLSAVEAKGSPR